VTQLLREMDTAGVDRAVIVPPSWEGERNDLGLKAGRLHPDRLGLMGRLDLEKSDASTQLLAWRKQTGMLGLRLTFRDHLVPEEGHWLWTIAAQVGVPIYLGVYGVYEKQMRAVIRAAERHPDLKLVICHLGIQNGKDDEAFANLNVLLTAARVSNIAVNATSLPSYTTDSYPFRRIHSYVRRVYDAFGPKRMFWGTDLSRLPCAYRQAITMFTEEMPWLTSEDKVWIMGRGLCEWIGWKVPAAALQANSA
jgi:predicted TIM-barrel fold metal-dependent hydrolase